MKQSLISLASVALWAGVLVPAASAQSPLILSLSPSSTAAGGPAFALTVNGSGFVNGLFNFSTVEWNGTALTTGFVSTSQITASVPASLIAAPGSANVTVVNPGGVTSNTVTFTISAGSNPTLSSIAPNSAVAGGPGFTMTANGSGFLNGAVLQWNGSSLATSYVSGAQLTAFVPANLIASTGTATVAAVNPGGAVSNVITFSVTSTSSPTLISLSPNSAAPGGPAFTLTANGTGFVSGAVVEWNGAPLSTNFVSTGQLSAFVPANLIAAPGSANVTVLNSSGSASNALSFSIATGSTATLSSLSPNIAAPGGASFTLTVNGSGFQNGAVVQWNGSTLATNFVNSNQLSAFVLSGLIATTGTASVTVTNPGGAPSNALTFSISPVTTPTLFSISPSFTVAGGSAFTLTANGSGFLNGATVDWNGAPLATSYVNTGQVTAFVPTNLIGVAGSSSITVVNPGGGASNALSFGIAALSPPSLVALSPNTASAGSPGFTLTVLGSNFVNGSVVEWNGGVLSTAFSSVNQLTAFVPSGLIVSPGAANITVLSPGGAVSNSLSLNINPAAAAPTVFSLSPNSAAAGGAPFTLTVTGSNFQSGAVVQWNGSPLPTGVGNNTQLSAAVPAALIANSGTAVITVVNPNGPASNAVTFSIFGFSSALRIAQIADGASWETMFQVVNLDQVPVTYSFQFWDDNGNPLALPISGGTPGQFSGTLAPGATAFAQTPGTSGTLSQGWAEVASSGRLGVLTIFRQSVAGRPDSEGTVSGVLSGSRVFLPFDDTNGYVTGVAVANTNPTQPLFITMVFQLENGGQSTGSLYLPPHAHQAFELSSMFPALGNVRGSVELTAATPDIAVVGLRFSPTDSFTSLGEFQ